MDYEKVFDKKVALQEGVPQKSAKFSCNTGTTRKARMTPFLMR
jgi:hypothetical protein